MKKNKLAKDRREGKGRVIALSRKGRTELQYSDVYYVESETSR